MILLDTHVLVWWVSGQDGLLSAQAADTIARKHDDGELLVSSISAWELAMLVSCGRLVLSLEISEWLALVSQTPSLRFVPVDNAIAVASATLPGDFHKDPADRLITATARKLGAPLVTADERIRAYPHVRTVW